MELIVHTPASLELTSKSKISLCFFYIIIYGNPLRITVIMFWGLYDIATYSKGKEGIIGSTWPLPPLVKKVTSEPG
jgi:hypothetical protein